MSDIGPIGGGASASGLPRLRSTDPASAPGQRAEPRAARRGADRVEVSDLAQSLARLNQEPPVRQELIDRVRAEIDAGTYETPQRVAGAVERILGEIDPSA